MRDAMLFGEILRRFYSDGSEDRFTCLSLSQAAVAMGASGVGLFRTEYLFLTHPDVPDEEQHRPRWRGVRFGFLEYISAMQPAVAGVAMLVPDIVV